MIAESQGGGAPPAPPEFSRVRFSFAACAPPGESAGPPQSRCCGASYPAPRSIKPGRPQVQANGEPCILSIERLGHVAAEAHERPAERGTRGPIADGAVNPLAVRADMAADVAGHHAAPAPEFRRPPPALRAGLSLIHQNRNRPPNFHVWSNLPVRSPMPYSM